MGTKEEKDNGVRKLLTERGIKFIPFDDGGVAIDLSDLSDEDLKFVNEEVFKIEE